MSKDNSELRQQFKLNWQAIKLWKGYQALQEQHSSDEAKSRYSDLALPCPACRKTVDEMTWLYFDSQSGHPSRAGWVTVCETCQQVVDFFLERQEFYPWEEVNAQRNNQGSQEQRIPEVKNRCAKLIGVCPLCNRSPQELSWIYFISSPESWDSLAGRAGWLVICDECQIQVGFIAEIIS